MEKTANELTLNELISKQLTLNELTFNSIQKIICIALPYRISITGGHQMK